MPLVVLASVLLPIVFHQHISPHAPTASHGLTTAAAAAAEPPTLSSTASRDARALRPPGDGDDDSDDDTACAALERDARADDDRAAEPPRKPKEWETRSPHFSAVLVPGSLAGRRERLVRHAVVEHEVVAVEVAAALAVVRDKRGPAFEGRPLAQRNEHARDRVHGEQRGRHDEAEPGEKRDERNDQEPAEPRRQEQQVKDERLR